MSAQMTASDLRRGLVASLGALRERRASIDSANVYPVPDGDTGTNLVMTMEATVEAAASAGDADADIARALTRGSLMGARGNSGVILAQILRGLASALEAGPAGPGEVAAGFARAKDLAYESVLDPAEGTILSVATAAADAAAGAYADVSAQLDAVVAAATAALARTPEQMPLLRHAGVVDAGGMGLVTILDALAATVAGRPVEPQPVQIDPSRCSIDVVAASNGPPAYAYEVLYLLDAPDTRIPALRSLLGTIGDSVAVIGADHRWRVHVHTDEPERAIAFGAAVGAPSDVETTSFAEQIAARAAASPAPIAASPAGEDAAEPPPGVRGVPLARAEGAATLVAAVSSSAARALFEGLGAVVIEQPASAVAFVEALAALPDERLIVLPNDDNLFGLALDLIGDVQGKMISLVRTTDLAEGMAAALAYGEGRAAEEVVAEMHEVLGRVVTGQVVIAPEGTTLFDGQTVTQGQAVGFVRGSPVAIEDDPVRAAAGVAASLLGSGTAVTVLTGEGVGDDERSRLRAALDSIGAGSVEIVDGGQPKHRYQLAVE